MSDREKKYGCIIYEDVFSRLDKRFDDEALGRILRAAYNYGFYGAITELDDPTEDYACADVMSVFDRNKEKLEDSILSGKIGAAMRHARSLQDFKERLKEIAEEHGITPYEQSEHVAQFKKKYPEKCP